MKEKLMQRTDKNIELFLDSGAFSAWTQDTEIDIQDYIQFIKDNRQAIDVYANLDVISGTKKESAAKTWENQKIMEQAGLNPIPVFHYGEPIQYLEKYMNEGYEYLSLGGMVPISNDQLIRWLDKLFSSHLTGEQGMPLVKIHGFGLTTLKLMLRYPWYSVDSTSWQVAGRMGAILVPRRRSGDWVYDENSLKISVSSRSPGRKDDKMHITNLSPRKKQIIMDYITEKGYELGESEFKKVDADYKPAENERWAEKDEDNDKRLLEIVHQPGLSNDYKLRDEINIIYYLDLEENLPDWPWAFTRKNERSQRSLL